MVRTYHHSRIDGILDELKLRVSQLEDTYKQNKTDNLTRGECLASKALKQNHDIVINKADKGSTIVVQDRRQA